MFKLVIFYIELMELNNSNLILFNKKWCDKIV